MSTGEMRTRSQAPDGLPAPDAAETQGAAPEGVETPPAAPEALTRLLGSLRRAPDVEAPNLVAVSAVDRELLRHARGWLAGQAAERSAPRPRTVVTVDDAHGAVTLGLRVLIAELGPADVRVRATHDARLAERVTLANELRATEAGEPVPGEHETVVLDPKTFAGASLVLLTLPKSLTALRETAALAGAPGGVADDARVVAVGATKHMTRAMNDELARAFERVEPQRAGGKVRAIIASVPRRRPTVEVLADWPRRARLEVGGRQLDVLAEPATFGGARLDEGTRLMVGAMESAGVLDGVPDGGAVIDLGSGTGVIAAWVAASRPRLRVLATDQSLSAAASSLATARANGLLAGDEHAPRLALGASAPTLEPSALAEGITVARQDALELVPPASADLVLCNPPFHAGTSIHAGIASRLFAEAARVLRPGGRFVCVFNSHLRYRAELERVIGPGEQLARDRAFTVTVHERRLDERDALNVTR